MNMYVYIHEYVCVCELRITLDSSLICFFIHSCSPIITLYYYVIIVIQSILSIKLRHRPFCLFLFQYSSLFISLLFHVVKLSMNAVRMGENRERRRKKRKKKWNNSCRKNTLFSFFISKSIMVLLFVSNVLEIIEFAQSRFLWLLFAHFTVSSAHVGRSMTQKLLLFFFRLPRRRSFSITVTIHTPTTT